MVLYDNTHYPTQEQRRRVKDLAIAGIPKYLICKVVGIDDDTLNKHYERELDCAEPEAIERMASTIVLQGYEGCTKSQALYMKTKGAKYGWVEKQVVETVSSEDTQALKEQIKELEGKFERDY